MRADVGSLGWHASPVGIVADVRSRIRPVELQLADLKAERDVLLTELRRRQRMAQREGRAGLREAMRAGEYPTVAQLVAAQCSVRDPLMTCAYYAYWHDVPADGLLNACVKLRSTAGPQRKIAGIAERSIGETAAARHAGEHQVLVIWRLKITREGAAQDSAG